MPIARKRASYPRAARLDAEESGMALSIKLGKLNGVRAQPWGIRYVLKLSAQ